MSDSTKIKIFEDNGTTYLVLYMFAVTKSG